MVHGQSKRIKVISQDLLFKGCPDKFNVGRYHSWVIDTNHFPDALEITATDEDANIMALKHKSLNVRAVQFHPESILSEYGETIIRNWLNS